MLLHKAWTYLCLLLGLQIVYNVPNNLVSYSVDVLPTLGGPNPVDERGLEEVVALAGGDCDIPTFIRRFGYYRDLTAVGLCIIHEATALQQGAIPSDLDFLPDRHRQVTHTSLNQTNHVGWETCLRVSEPSIVGLPTQSDRGLGLGSLDLRRSYLRHIVGKCLVVRQCPARVYHPHLERLREYVDQLYSIPILAAYQLLLLFVVVCGCQ